MTHWVVDYYTGKGQIPCGLLSLCLKELQPKKNYVFNLSSKLTRNRTLCRMRVEYYEVWREVTVASLIGIPAPSTISNVTYRNLFDMSEPTFSSPQKRVSVFYYRLTLKKIILQSTKSFAQHMIST